MLASAFLLVPLKPGVSMGGFYKRRFKSVLPPMIAFTLFYTFLPLLESPREGESGVAAAVIRN